MDTTKEQRLHAALVKIADGNLPATEACQVAWAAVMEGATWHKGPPPSKGWWPASDGRVAGCVRWWNGKRWSRLVTPADSAHSAAIHARIPDNMQADIEWQQRPAHWPERSRT